VSLSSDSDHTVNSVKAELKAQAREQGIGFGSPGMGMGGVGVEESRTAYQTVAEVESREPFSVGPGETKTVNLQLYVDGSAGSGAGQANNVGGAMGGIMRTMANIAGSLDHVNYIYRVYASAEVEGVTLHPSDHQPIELLPPQTQPQATQPIENLEPNQPPVAFPPNMVEPPTEQNIVIPDQTNQPPQS
jgi:hypothetical protein